MISGVLASSIKIESTLTMNAKFTPLELCLRAKCHVIAKIIKATVCAVGDARLSMLVHVTICEYYNQPLSFKIRITANAFCITACQIVIHGT
jgi:hypothetical protein